jgi:hypothetical protein
LIWQKREPAAALPWRATAFANPFTNEESERRESRTRRRLREDTSKTENQNTGGAHIWNIPRFTRRRGAA